MSWRERRVSSPRPENALYLEGMKIAVFEITESDRQALARAFPNVELLCDDKKVQESSLSDPEAEMMVVFVASAVNASVLDRFPKLKYIATRSTGFDHIDLLECARRKIVISNVPSYGEHTVAEFAFGLILALSRKIYLGVNRLKESGEFSYDGLQGFDLRDKTLGVVGTGRIGRHMIDMGQGFAMKVVGYDPFPDKKLAKAKDMPYASLDDLLKQSDVVSIHVPYMKETHHLINEKNLPLMKTTALLINVSRGGLVDTNALLQAIKTGKLGGTAMDVLEEEGAIKDEMGFLQYGHPTADSLKTILEDHELMRLPNVLVTPHMAFNTQEGVERIMTTTIQNIAAFLAGKPINVVHV